MIIIISAPSSTGKTYLASQLVKELHYPCVSIDHIKMGLYRGMCHCPFHPEDEDEKITLSLWPVIKGMIETCLENNQNHIIEGVYVDLMDLSHLMKQYPNQIIAVNLCFSDDYISSYFQDIQYHRHVVEHRGYEDTRTIVDFLKEHQLFKQQCQLANLAYDEINDDYQKTINDIIKRIISKLR